MSCGWCFCAQSVRRSESCVRFLRNWGTTELECICTLPFVTECLVSIIDSRGAKKRRPATRESQNDAAEVWQGSREAQQKRIGIKRIQNNWERNDNKKNTAGHQGTKFEAAQSERGMVVAMQVHRRIAACSLLWRDQSRNESLAACCINASLACG